MSTYEPGTVAVATANGHRNVRVFRTGCPSNMGWEYNRPDGTGHAWHSDRGHTVTDIRPLVVLDLDDPEFTVAALRDTLPEKARDHDRLNIEVLRLARQIEAQTKPPRIPEPGWGAIVEAGVEQHDERLLWMPKNQGFWACKNPDEYARHWQQLIDPTLVRPGIEDEL